MVIVCCVQIHLNLPHRAENTILSSPATAVWAVILSPSFIFRLNIFSRQVFKGHWQQKCLLPVFFRFTYGIPGFVMSLVCGI